MNDLNNTATDTRAVSTIPFLQENALYIHNNLLHIATSPSEAEPLRVDPLSEKGSALPPVAELTLYASPGTDLWTERMVQFRTMMLEDAHRLRGYVKDARNYANRLEANHEQLGEALLAKAEEHDWCDEYDEFAEEWDLPKRMRDYEVTVTVRVRAKSGDDAEEFVGENFGLSTFDDNVIDNPSVYAAEL